MNILISILNESCGDAKSNAEENAKELEMAGFIEERLMENFHEGSNWTEFKLFCDETIFFNMCLSETEPFYLNSECITRCTEERMLKVEKFERLIVLTRRTEYMEADYLREENDFNELLLLMINPSVLDSEKKSNDHP